MAAIKKALIGVDGAEVVLIETGQGNQVVELSGKDDGAVWLVGGDGRMLPFIFQEAALLESGQQVEISTLAGEKVAGSFVELGDLGLVVRAGQTVVIPRKALGKLTLPEAIPLPSVSFHNPGVAIIRYRTPSLTATLRTLFIVETGRAGIWDSASAADGEDQQALAMTAETSVELKNRSEKPQNIETAVVVSHPVRPARKARGMEMLERAVPAAQAAPTPGPAKSASSEADVFTASMSNVSLAPRSTFSVPLDAWNFAHTVVTTLSAGYYAWSREPIYLSGPETQILVVSEDERLFPGGATSVVIDDAEVSDTVTPLLAQGESMLVRLFPNQRVTAKAENVRVTAPAKKLNLTRSGPAELDEKFAFVDFDVSIEARQARQEETLLLNIEGEVVSSTVPEKLKTKDGALYYLITIPKGKQAAKTVHFKIRVTAE